MLDPEVWRRLAIIKAAEVVDLVAFEGGDEGALVSVKDHLGEKMAYSLDVDQTDDVHLASQALRGLLVPLETFHSTLVPELALTAAGAQAFEDLRPDILHVVIEVSASTRNCAHHLSLCLVLVGRNDICVAVVAATGRHREDATDERILILERLIPH